jgi:mRNA-degrading endonuclease RelE of RelBE toxin-antitoxin system
LRYFVEYEEGVRKSIDKLKDKVLIADIKSKIDALESNPFKGKCLYKNLYELKAKNFRVYYLVYQGVVVIESVEYDGRVFVKSVGDKDSQFDDVKQQKRSL